MDAEILTRLYRGMLRIRIVEERIAELYPQQEMRCPVHLCIGQEAVAVGVCDALDRGDYVFSNHRSHGHYLAKGGDLRSMIAEIYGKATGCAQGKGGSMHLVDLDAGFLGATPIVGSTIPIGVGAAWGSALKGESRVAVVFFGDGALEEGVFHESLNFALLKKVPVIFVCENNLYSVYSPLAVRQPGERELFCIAGGHGVESHQADGNDVLAVRSLAERAVEKARGGGGPTFLEFKTYRWREHCGPNYDDDLGYRPETEFLEWKKRCPIAALRERLLEAGICSDRGIGEMESAVKSEMEAAVEFARRSPWPADTLLMGDVYAS
ncbi:MAG: thiamine pyrophosphate-dependent dehydrogenase E1 component subunit alpha [Planctomycetes bacterium]|nr:thiamine pyrophosphate-dependent dehydrogenase E1 component subunit alpha [Planctomycetota bacterium]